MPVETTRGRAMAEAITSPSAVLLAGAGASVAILAGAPVLAPVAALAAWGVRVWTKLPKVEGRERIDLHELREPWRTFVRDAMHAHDKFLRAVSSTSPGPLHDRLAEVGARVADGVHACWSIARRGQQLARAVRDLRRDRIERELSSVEAQLKRDPGADDLQAAARSLREQLASADRLASVAQDAADKLTRINAELDEAVARAVELSLSLEVGDAATVSPLGSDVETIVGELESLRLALDEASRA